MSVVPNVVNRKRKKTESKPQSQLNKCLNEKRRREQENIYIEELAELISASTSDMSSLSVKPDKCAILQETVNQIRRIKQEPGQSDELQQSEVSSSKPTILANDIYGPLLLEALDGFLFVVNIDGKIEFVSENITSFLKYSQDDIVDKSIYNIIHTGDRAHFSSNLLPMMSLGNGCGWTSDPNSGITKSRSFNCRFLIKPTENPHENMEEKQTPSHLSQYENMQVSAVFFPFTRDISENAENLSGENRLACVARRIPSNEKSPTSLGVEQFTTRLDISGKIIAVDTSGVSSSYSQYLSNELVGHSLQELCYPTDIQKIDQHLKDTIQSNSSTTVVYKLRVGLDRYVPVQTKSKLFHFNQSSSEQEFIMSTHSIIRDSDSPASSLVEGSPKSIGSPSHTVSTPSSAGGAATIAASTNGGGNISSLSLPSTYSGFSSFSPANSELVLSDLMLDIFPNSSWNLEQNTVSRGSTSVTAAGSATVNSTHSIPASSHSSGRIETTQSENSAFSPEERNCKNGSSSSSSAPPGRASTPLNKNTGCYSPAPVQTISGNVSPTIISSTKTDKLTGGGVKMPDMGVSNSGRKLEGRINVQSNQKLRNLLTQNTENSSVHLNQRKISREDDVIILNRSVQISESGGQATRQITIDTGMPRASASSGNIILRELLNQDDEDALPNVHPDSEEQNTDSRLSELLLNAGPRKASNHQKSLGENNMLRKLLNNNDEVSRSCTSSEDIIHQLLLKADTSDRERSLQNCRIIGDHELSNIQLEDSAPRQFNVAPSLTSSSINSLSESLVPKRKSAEHSQPTNSAKKHNAGTQRAHLAGQNPMLASMLAQTPRTPLSVPTCIANSIMSQLPQERLPKNLEKKLVHTPCTIGPATSSITSTTQTSHASARLLLTAASIQQDVVTSDSRGHVIQHPSLNLQPVLNKTMYSQPQQGFLNKMLSGSTESTPLSRSLSTPANLAYQLQQNPSGFSLQLPQNLSESTGSSNRGLREMLSDNMSTGSNAMFTAPIHTTQSSDPVLSEILEQIYSLQEEMNVVTASGDESADILKLLDDAMDTQSASVITVPSATIMVRDIKEKNAISAIQKQLMSFEGSPSTSSTGSITLQNPALIPTSHQPGRQTNQNPQKSQSTGIAFNTLEQYTTASQPPTYSSSVVSGRVRFPFNTPANTILSNSQQILGLAAMQRIALPQHGGSGANVSQVKRSIFEKRQKMYLQQQQKRLLEQQQKQQMTMQTQQPLDPINSPGTAPFTENINDLINNTVAPNVTLQRSSSMIESQLSPCYNTNIISPLPSPATQQTSSQLSPSQHGNPQSPFSPLSQQPFPSQTPPSVAYQQSRLSPHSSSPYPQGGSSHSPSPVPPAGACSPHLQLSPQQGSGPPQWSQRPSKSPIPNNLQQQNPMLNAQLSQASFNNKQTKFTAQQREQLMMRPLPSPGSIQNSRNSPFVGQPERSYSPLSPVAVRQCQSRQSQPHQQQQRIQRTVSGPGQLNSAFSSPGQSGGTNYNSPEPVRSPQTLPSPSYSQSVPTTPVTTFASVPASSSGVLYKLSQDGTVFTFDKQNLQLFTSNGSDRSRAGSSAQVSSDYIRQELRAIVGARTLHQSQANQNNQTQALLSQPQNTSTTTTLNLHPFSRQTLEDLGLTVELMPGENTSVSQGFPQSLLSIAGGFEGSSSHVGVPSPRAEEPKPTDQKKSLLQQLLSEPT